MTTYNTDQTAIYNQSVKRTNTVKRKLAKLYTASFEKIEGQLAKIQIAKLEGVPVSEFQEQRLQRLLFQIDQEIRRLRLQTQSAIRVGMVGNFENTYLNSAYILEREVNLGTAFQGLKFDVKFNYPIVPREVIRAALTDERVAGHTFKDRMLRDQRLLQFQIREQTAQAVIEGIPIKEFEGRVATIKDQMGKATARVQATARTEMLRAYSIGQQEAIDLAEDGGLAGVKVWRATLDGRTREDHIDMDGVEADDKGIFTLPDGSTGEFPRDSSLSAAESINCRCRELYEPLGIKPTKRTAKLPNGKWETIDANTTARKWRNSLKKPKPADYKKDIVKQKTRLKTKGESTTFNPATTQKEAFTRLESFTKDPVPSAGNALYRIRRNKFQSGPVGFEGLELNKLNSILKANTDVLGKYNIKISDTGYQRKRTKSLGSYLYSFAKPSSPNWTDSIQFQKTFLSGNISNKVKKLNRNVLNLKQKRIDRLKKSIADERRPQVLKNKLKKDLENIKLIKRHNVFESVDDPLYNIASHEGWHAVMRQNELESVWRTNLFKKGSRYEGGKNKSDWFKLSEYAASDVDELWAEVGSAIDSGLSVPAPLKKIFNETLREVNLAK